MAALFQTALMRLALCGLAVSLALLTLRSRIARDTFARLLSIWRSLTAFGRVAVCSFLLIGVLVGGDKTNGVNNLPPQMMSPMAQQGHGFLLTGLLVNGNLANVMNLAQPQTTFAERKTANWNIRGAWKDSFWLDFEGGWVFPWGTNHLSSVEVVSYGQVWATPFDTNAVASAGAPFEIVPGLTTFAYEFTPSNSYRFVWTGAAINRDTNNLVAAALELFRNGDVSVTTNGIATLLPRTLPFPHSGFGQDDEWVTANFTNAAEILAVGYPQWVNDQVGEGLTNGLYKLSVTVAGDPPETTFLFVGDLSVAVTNAGEYVFLLEKGPAYDLTVFPPSSNVTITAVDDVPTMRGTPMMRSAWSWGDGTWSVDMGEFVCDYYPGMPSAVCWWLPWLCGSPDVVHIGPSDPQMEFVAQVFDCVHPENATFEWEVSEGLVASTPYAQSTLVTAVDIPSWSSVSMSVTAFFGFIGNLTSSLGFTVGTNATPQAGVSVSVPRVMFQNDDDDNCDGIVDYEMVNFGNVLTNAEDDIVKGSVVFRSDVLTNGTVRIELSGFPGDVYTNDCEAALVSERFDVAIEGEVSRTVDIYFNPVSWAPYQSPRVTAVWIPEVGEPQTSSVPFSVVKPVAETICSETVEHSVLGTNHVYVLNPCGVAVGDDAYFRIAVSPSSLPDSEIVWTNRNGRIEFVGGNIGRNVHVRGVSVGDAELEVIIGGRDRQAPTFPLKVVTPQTFKITAWIVSDAEGNVAKQVDDVQNMIAPLNDIYRQVGVSFYLDFIAVTNIPDAFNLLYDSATNDVWNFYRLVDIGQNTGGIECYFVNDIIHADGRAGPVGANSAGGIVIRASATVGTLAHEIGHAFGLRDIYVSAREKDEYVFGADDKDVGQVTISSSSAPEDWNGGCCGFGDSGARYYQGGTKMSAIIPRLVMYGIVTPDDIRRDITTGNVDGIWYLGDGASRVWYDSDASIGFLENPFRKESPCHN